MKDNTQVLLVRTFSDTIVIEYGWRMRNFDFKEKMTSVSLDQD